MESGEAQVLDKLRSLLSEITGAPLQALGPASSPGNTPGWDSVANLGFIAAVEEEFAIDIPTAEVMKLNSLADVTRLLESRRAVAAR